MSVSFSNSDLINIGDISCNSIDATGYIGPMIHAGISGNNVTTDPSGYFDPWAESVIRKGIDYNKFSEYLGWTGDAGVGIGGESGGWICSKPCLAKFNTVMTINEASTEGGEAYFRKYNSALTTISSINSITSIDSNCPFGTCGFSKIEYLDTGDIVQMTLRNNAATTCKTSTFIHLIKDGADIAYTDE